MATDLLKEGDQHLEQGEWEEARRCFQDYLDEHPDEAVAHLKLGHWAKAQGDDQAAVPYYHQALELDPGNLEALFNCGEALMALRSYGEAVEIFSRILETAPPGSEVVRIAEQELRVARAKLLTQRGGQLLQQGAFAEALEAFVQAVELNPDDVRNYSNAGVACLQMGDPDGGLSWFQRAVAQDPGYVRGLYNLGGLYLNRGWFLHAEQVYQRALDLEPDGRDSEDIRARLERSASGMEEARQELLSILQGEAISVNSQRAAQLITGLIGQEIQTVDIAVQSNGKNRLIAYSQDQRWSVESNGAEALISAVDTEAR